MNLNESVEIYSKQFIHDGIGGGEYKEAYHSSIICKVAPINTKLINSNERIVTYQILKLFTETKIELEDFTIKYKDKKYKKFSETDYTKIFMYELELI